MRAGFGHLLLCLAVMLAAGTVHAREDCDDGCALDHTVAGTYNVVSPVGGQHVEPIAPAPRLRSLEAKTIALVGGSFMARVTHGELKNLILRHYPAARVLMFDEVGTAGVYPAPGVRRQSVETFKRRLKELHVDAVVAGNGGCGICTPKEVGSCIAAEQEGIPAVMVAAPGFDDQAVATARHHGVKALRVATYPGAFASHSTDLLVENTRKVLWPQVLKGLTGEDTRPAATDTTRHDTDPRAAVFNGTVDEVNRFFVEMSWSDGLPIIPPTVERIEEFLRYTDHPCDEVVAVLSPAFRSSLVWHVAVNGVMAGCPPEYMPVLIALTRAMADPNFRRTLASTHAWTPYCWVNGPVARQLGFDYGQGLINEAANVALGRFLNLAMMNLAGYYVKQDRMGTFGYPVSWCLAEDEQACLSMGWQPFHVRQGYGLNRSTVTVSSALLWGNNMAPATTDGEIIMQLLAWDITQRCQLAVGSGMQYTFRTVLLTREVARHLSERYGTLANLEDRLIETARRPLHERTFANYYANPGSSFDPDKVPLRRYRHRIEREEQAAMTATPEWYATNEERLLTIPTMRKGETAFLVTGDPSRNKIQTLPGGGLATVAIDLPADWNALMAAKGYPPLSSMCLTPTDGTDGLTGAVRPENAPVRTDYHNPSRQPSNHRRGSSGR